MKKILILFLTAFYLSAFAQAAPINASEISIQPRSNSWDYYQGLNKISEADFLRLCGQPDRAAEAETYARHYELKQNASRGFLIAGTILMGAGVGVMALSPSAASTDKRKNMLVSGLATEGIGIGFNLGAILIKPKKNNPPNYLSSEEAIGYMNSYNAKLSTQ